MSSAEEVALAGTNESTLPPELSLRLDPDAVIRVHRDAPLLLIEFVATEQHAPMALDPKLAGLFLREAAVCLPKRKLNEAFSLSSFSWAAVCIMGHFRLSGAIAARSFEQNRPLHVAEAQAVLLSLESVLRHRVNLDPFLIGRALSACVLYLGTGVSDLYDVGQPLRRFGEVGSQVVLLA